jgi:hypothetical protein
MSEEHVTLEAKKIAVNIPFSQEMADHWSLSNSLMDDAIRRLMQGMSIPSRYLGTPSTPPADDPQPIIVEEGAEPCECCGKMALLSEFRGWKHYGDECDMLCDECYENATMEE